MTVGARRPFPGQLPGNGRRTGCRWGLGRGRSRVSAAPVCTLISNRTVDRAASPHTLDRGAAEGQTMSLALFASFSGIDVSEGQLDVHRLPDGSSTSFAHSAAGIGRLVAWLASRERPLVVVEASRCRGSGRGAGPRGRPGGGGQPAPDPRLRPRRRPWIGRSPMVATRHNRTIRAFHDRLRAGGKAMRVDLILRVLSKNMIIQAGVWAITDRLDTVGIQDRRRSTNTG